MLYRAPVEHILGRVCDGDQVAFVNQRTGQVLVAGVAEALHAPPSLLYLDDRTLVQQSADGETQALAAVPGLGDVRDALHVGELVLVLETGGLQLVPLGESAQAGFVTFDDPILFGQLVKLNEAEVLIAGHVESGCAATGLGAGVRPIAMDRRGSIQPAPLLQPPLQPFQCLGQRGAGVALHPAPKMNEVLLVAQQAR